LSEGVLLPSASVRTGKTRQSAIRSASVTDIAGKSAARARTVIHLAGNAMAN
jgi:hypothetical protein